LLFFIQEKAKEAYPTIHHYDEEVGIKALFTNEAVSKTCLSAVDDAGIFIAEKRTVTTLLTLCCVVVIVLINRTIDASIVFDFIELLL